MSVLSFAGLPVGIFFLLQTTTPSGSNLDPFIETLKNMFVVLGTIFIPVLWDYVRRTRKDQREAKAITPTKEDVKVVADDAKDDHAKLLGRVMGLTGEIETMKVEQTKTKNVVNQLTNDLAETREERDKFKESWGVELTEHSKTKLRLNEAVETNVELVKVNIEKHDTNLALQNRLEALELKVESYQPVELLAQTILAGMSNTIATALANAFANMPPKLVTGETAVAAGAPTAEVIGQN